MDTQGYEDKGGRRGDLRLSDSGEQNGAKKIHSTARVVGPFVPKSSAEKTTAKQQLKWFQDCYVRAGNLTDAESLTREGHGQYIYGLKGEHLRQYVV